MKKRLIYQVYLGKKSNLYDFCTQSVKEYCEKYGIDYKIQTSPILRILPDMKRTGRNKSGLIKEMGYLPIFEKENAFAYLDDYDQIAIIDSDIYIRKDAPNIFEDLSEDFDFGGVLERSGPINASHKTKIKGYSRDMFQNMRDVTFNWNGEGADFMNMGMMVMNKSLNKYLEGQTPEQFIRRKEFVDFVDGIDLYKYSTDQVLLNYWLKKCGAKVKHMDWKWNALYRAIKDDQIKNAHFVHFFLKQQIRPGNGEDLTVVKKVLGL
jgi:hypothetical protein